MPLSTFLMMHGCSMAETARSGIGSHGASSVLLLSASTSCSLLFMFMFWCAGSRIHQGLTSLAACFADEQGSNMKFEIALYRLALMSKAPRCITVLQRTLSGSRLHGRLCAMCLSSNALAQREVVMLLRLAGVCTVRQLVRLRTAPGSTSSHHTVALSWHFERPTHSSSPQPLSTPNAFPDVVIASFC